MREAAVQGTYNRDEHIDILLDAGIRELRLVQTAGQCSLTITKGVAADTTGIVFFNRFLHDLIVERYVFVP